MKKMMPRLCALVLVLSCLAGFSSALAANRASYYLLSYQTWVGNGSNGEIIVHVSVNANQIVKKLGAEILWLEESSDGGRTWHQAEMYAGEEWMSTTDKLAFSSSTTYQGTIGNQYRVYGTVFASDGPGAGDSRTTKPSNPITAKK